MFKRLLTRNFFKILKILKILKVLKARHRPFDTFRILRSLHLPRILNSKDFQEPFKV